MALGLLAKKVQAVQQAPTMASQVSKTVLASLLARRQAQTFSTGEERSENTPGDCF